MLIKLNNKICWNSIIYNIKISLVNITILKIILACKNWLITLYCYKFLFIFNNLPLDGNNIALKVNW